jgi:hypothetical protein
VQAVSDLIEVIQKIAQDAQDGTKPTDLVFGTVAAGGTVILENTMLPIPASALILTDNVVSRSVKSSDGATVQLSRGLSPGERVVMLRCASGQRFIVLSRAY